MAENENIYYIEKPEEIQNDNGGVWQAFTEVVAYEDAAVDVNSSQLDISYVDENNSNSEHYETAIEDNTHYYSVMEDSSTDVTHTSLLEHVEQDVQHVEHPEEAVNQLHDQLKYNVGYGGGNVTVVSYPNETIIPDQNSNEDQYLPQSNEKIVEDGNELEGSGQTEDEDQVILYKIEGSNELFAVQIAKDGDGNIQKYQYRVRQNEDGQLEAVPGTIRIQTEDEDFPIENLSNEKNAYEPTVQDDVQPVQEPNPCENLTIHENQPNNDLNFVQEQNIEPQDQQYLNEQETDQFQHFPDQVETPNEEYSQYNEEQQQLQSTIPNDIVTQALQNATAEHPECDEVYNDLQFQYQAADKLENFNQELSNVTTPYFQEQQFTNIEYEQQAEQEKLPKNYPKGNTVSVLSQVVFKRNEKPNKPKQILNKLTDSFKNESIELKRISNSTKQSPNKLTFLIVTHPVPDNQHPPPKPRFTHLKNQRLVYSLPNIVTPAPQQLVKKRFRSILRPTASLQQKGKTYVQSTIKTKITPAAPVAKIVNHLLKKTNYINNNTIKNESVINTVYNKGPRQPRKQVITPVDRVGSEIIIQAPEEKPELVETFDLDEFSEDESTKKYKRGRIPKGPKRRARKLKQIPMTPTIEILNSGSNSVSNNSQSNGITETKPTEFPKSELSLTKKRGPGRPRADVKKSYSYIHKEVIMEQENANQKARPKFIRTQNINSETEIKENNAPKKRGRPPKLKPKPKPVLRQNNEVLSDGEGPAKRKKIDEIDHLMGDIHGDDYDDESDMIVERLDDEDSDVGEEKEETLLSILETSEVPEVDPLALHQDELEEGEVTQQDILTMSLHATNIIQTSEDIEAHLLKNVLVNSKSSNAQANKKRDFIQIKAEEGSLNPQQKLPESAKIVQKTTSIKKQIGLPSIPKEIYKCSLCPKTFSKYLLLKTHKIEEHKLNNKQGKFPCKQCPRIFLLEKTLKVHENLKHPKETKTSQPIETQVDVPSDKLIKLTNSVTKTLPTAVPFIKLEAYNCDKCTNKFTNLELLNDHKKTHQRKVPAFKALNQCNSEHKCNICSKTFRQLSHLVIHRENHHKKVSCSNCGLVYSSKHLLDEHKRRYCLKLPKSPKMASTKVNISVRSAPSKLFNCDKCQKQFRNQLFYNNHMRLQHPKQSPERKQPQVHRLSIKNPIKKVSPKKSNETFSFRRQSVRLQVPSQKLSPMTCDLCNQKFITCTALFKHKRNHPDTKFKCSTCNFGFESKLLLTEHEKIHSNKTIPEGPIEQLNSPSTSENIASQITPVKDMPIPRTNSEFIASLKKIKIDEKKLGHDGIPLLLNFKRKRLLQ